MSHHDVDCSNGLLQTDIGLIAVNETHAVFSIRIERAKLAENHFFLNVISDIAGGDGRLQMPRSGFPFSPASDPPRRSAKWRKAALFGTVVAALSAIPLVEMADATSNQPPYKLFAAEVLTPMVVPGGELIIKAINHRVRNCPTMVSRNIYREADGTSVHQESVPAISTEPEPAPIATKFAVRIPRHLVPGFYQYQATAISDCGDKIFTARQPALTFEVRPTPDDPAALAEVPARGAILR